MSMSPARRTTRAIILTARTNSQSSAENWPDAAGWRFCCSVRWRCSVIGMAMSEPCGLGNLDRNLHVLLCYFPGSLDPQQRENSGEFDFERFADRLDRAGLHVPRLALERTPGTLHGPFEILRGRLAR